MSESKLKRRSFLAGSGLALAGAGFAAGRSTALRGRALPSGMDEAELAEMRLPPPRDPDEALERLVNGNRLFVGEYYEVGDGRRDQGHRLTLAENQHPFALILGCSDSRVSPELLFNAQMVKSAWQEGSVPGDLGCEVGDLAVSMTTARKAR